MIKIFREGGGVVTSSKPLPPTNNFYLYPPPVLRCMIKIFRGEGVVDEVGGSSGRCLKWGGGGWGVIKGSFQKHLKIGGG